MAPFSVSSSWSNQRPKTSEQSWGVIASALCSNLLSFLLPVSVTSLCCEPGSQNDGIFFTPTGGASAASFLEGLLTGFVFSRIWGWFKCSSCPKREPLSIRRMALYGSLITEVVSYYKHLCLYMPVKRLEAIRINSYIFLYNLCKKLIVFPFFSIIIIVIL